MKFRRLAGALLMIAAGLLACWAARGDSSNISEFGRPMPSLDTWLLSMYSDGLFDSETAPAAWTTESGNLTLTAGAHRDSVSDPSLSEDDACWPAVSPPDSEIGEVWAASFGHFGLPAGIDWDMVSHPVAHPNDGSWTAGMEPSFEMARHWREAM